MIFLTICWALMACLVFLDAAVWFAQTRGRKLFRDRIYASSVPKALLIQSYIEESAALAPLSLALWDQLRAPFVLLLPLIRLPKEANDLPESLAYWRNDVSINGDGYGWKDEAGAWHQCSQEPCPPGVIGLSYSDPAYEGDAYYARGHHPRSWYARWIWLAFRNVAVKRMADLGPKINERPQLLFEVKTDTTWQRLFALPGTSHYQWHSLDKLGPFCLWTNVGAKLATAYDFPEVVPCRAVVTGTWRGVRLWSNL